MSNRKRSIFTPELSTVKSLNEADTDELWIPAQQVTDDAVVKVSVSQLGGDISSKINHQGTYNRGDLNAHPQYTLTSSFNNFQNQVEDDLQDLQGDLILINAEVGGISSSVDILKGTVASLSSSVNSLSSSLTQLSSSVASQYSQFLSVSSSFVSLSQSFVGVSSSHVTLTNRFNTVSSSFIALSASYGPLSSSFVGLSSSFNTLSSSLAGEYLKLNGSNSPTGNINWNYFDIYNPGQISSDSGVTFNATTFNFVAVDETYFTSPYFEFTNEVTFMNGLKLGNPNFGIYNDTQYIGFVAGGDDVAFFGNTDIYLNYLTRMPVMDLQGVRVGPASELDTSGNAQPYGFVYASGSYTGELPKMLAASDLTGLQMSVKWGSAKYENGMSLADFGNAGFQAPTSTNYQSRMQLGIYYTVGTAGNSAGAYDTNDIVYMGNAWVWHTRVAPNMTNLTQQRGFFGLQSGKAVIGNVNPSTLTNIIGFGYDATDANIQFMRNDGSGTATKTSTGISARTTGMVLDLWICCNGNGTIRAFCQRLDAAGGWIGGNVTTNLPSSTAFLNPIIWTNNNAQAAAAWCGVQKIIIETI